MTVRVRTICGLGMAGAVALALSCGGSTSSGGGSTTTPTPTSPGTTPSGAVNTTTITISNNSVSPKNIIVAAGSQVTFVNSDNQPHDMESDPHPEHTDCPAINQVGFLNPGQTRQSGNLVTKRVCGFHDHNQPSTSALEGSITIQ